MSLLGTIMSNDPSLERKYAGHKGQINSIDFEPNLKHLASGASDGTIMLWHFLNKQRAYRLNGHKDAVYEVRYNQTGELLASASRDKTVRLWTPDAQGKSIVMHGHTASVRTVDFNDHSHILTGSDDKSIKVWNLSRTKFLYSLTGHTNWIRSARFSPDFKTIVSGGDDKTVRLWDHEAKKCAMTLENNSGAVLSVAFHPAGSCVAAAFADSRIKLWDIRMGKLLQFYCCHEGPVNDISFHPIGNFMLSSSNDGTLKILDLMEGRAFYTLHGHTKAVHAAQFSKNGEYFASGGADNHVIMWKTNFDAQHLLNAAMPETPSNDAKLSGLKAPASTDSGQKVAASTEGRLQRPVRSRRNISERFKLHGSNDDVMVDQSIQVKGEAKGDTCELSDFDITEVLGGPSEDGDEDDDARVMDPEPEDYLPTRLLDKIDLDNYPAVKSAIIMEAEKRRGGNETPTNNRYYFPDSARDGKENILREHNGDASQDGAVMQMLAKISQQMTTLTDAVRRLQERVTVIEERLGIH